MWVSGWDGEPTGKRYGVRSGWNTTVPPDAAWVPFVSKAHESWQPHLADAIDERVRAGKPWTLAISTAWPAWFGFPAQAAALVIAPLSLVGLVIVGIRTAKAAQPRTT